MEKHMYRVNPSNLHQEQIVRAVSTVNRVVVTFAREGDGDYSFTVADSGSGAVLGRIFRPAGPAGGPPRLHVVDVLHAVGSVYRHGCIEVDLLCRDVARRSNQMAVRLRRRRRQWFAPSRKLG